LPAADDTGLSTPPANSRTRRLKQFEDENNKLRKVVVDLSLDKEMLQGARRRKLVDEMRGDWNVSIRRARHVFLLDRSTYRYRSRRPGQTPLEQLIKELCQTRVRYGYRRIHVLLRREGWHHGQNKTRRIYRELGLQLRNKTPKRRVKAKLREDRRPAKRSNETWAMDFVHDQLATGTKLCVLTIVNTFSRFSPAIEPRFNSRGAYAVEVLERVGSARQSDEGDLARRPGRMSVHQALGGRPLLRGRVRLTVWWRSRRRNSATCCRGSTGGIRRRRGGR